ncbi:MAG TPA: nicotianamine synthase family protein [Patescibacteria group bacterium]|nr:nicotianamine synthase family protein [Patescibacteria group bacterium]
MQKLYNEITNLDNYLPSEKVNRLFSTLVENTLKEEKNNLNKKQIENLQKVCSSAEYELEKYWSQKNIYKFPYFENYLKLTKLEWFSLKSCSVHKKHKILFVGGGPLPMTAIMLAKIYRQKVTILEKEKEAVDLSSSLIKELKLQNKIKVIQVDALDFEGYKNFNAIFVAALAGINSNIKDKILEKIKKQTLKNTHILARSSWGARRILYKPLSKHSFKIFKPVMEVKPMNDIVNSFVIFQNI